MKRINTFLTTIPFLLLGLFGFSQTTDFVWASTAGGNSLDDGKVIIADKNDNVYTAGIYRNTATFDGFSLTAIGSYEDVYLAKYNASGGVDWVKSIGGPASDNVTGVDLDDVGNIYITGTFSTSITIDQTTLTSGGSTDFFVAKYTSSGNLIWAKSYGNSGSDQSKGISFYESNIYLSGHYSNTLIIGSDTVTSKGSSDIFTVKLDSTGNGIWLMSAGGNGAEFSKGIGVTKGIVYISGDYTDDCIFNSTTLTLQRYMDIFVAAYTTDGKYKWAKSALGDYGNYPNGMCDDGNGNAYIIGCFGSTIKFDNISLSSNGLVDIFIAKYDSTGTCVWAKKDGSTSYDQGYGIFADKYSVAITGFFRDNTKIGGVSLTSYGGNDIFFAEYDISGNFQWAKNAGSSDWDLGRAICKSSKAIYGTGNYGKTGNFGSQKITSFGNSDAYITKIAIPVPPSIIITKHPESHSVCEGETVNFYVAAQGKGMKYQWKKSGSPITGATDTFIIIKDVKKSDAGAYSCTISDSSFSITSNPGVLSFGGEPVITQQPTNKTIYIDQKVTLKVIATGAKSYQWQKDGVDLIGQTENTLIIISAKESDEGKYVCIIEGICGNTVSNEVTLTVRATSIDQNDIANLISISPNPSSGIINLRTLQENSALTIEIYDSKGKLTIRKNIDQYEETVDLTSFSKGIYIVLGKSNDKNYIGKIILR